MRSGAKSRVLEPDEQTLEQLGHTFPALEEANVPCASCSYFFYILFFLFFFDCASCLRENLSPSGMIQVCSRNTYLLVQVYNTKGNPAIIDLKLVANGSVVMSE